MYSNQFRSGASVLTFNTAKSSLTKLSRRSGGVARQDAVTISQATAQAVQAAKAILNAGGSELTALKTAKAAAVSALMPETADNDMSSGIGTSFLRRRKLKRQAEVVASMALASAMASGCKAGADAVTEWDQGSNTASSSLKGLKIVNRPTTSVTLSTSSKCSSSNSHHSESQGSRKSGSNNNSNNKTMRQTAAEMITQQLRLIPPALASTFSSGENSFSRQVSSFTHSTSKDSAMYHHMAAPNDLRPRRTNSRHSHNHRHHYDRHQGRHDKCTVFSNPSQCLEQSFSDEFSSDSEAYTTTGAVDSVLMTIANALSCGASALASHTQHHHHPHCYHGTPASEVQVPIIDEEEYEEYDEETITFEEEQRKEKQPAPKQIRALGSPLGGQPTSQSIKTEQTRTFDEVPQKKHVQNIAKRGTIDAEEEQGVEAAHPAVQAYESESIADILEDLMAITPELKKNIPVKLPDVITSDRNDIELEVHPTLDSFEELTMDGMSFDGDQEGSSENDENGHYVEIVDATPKKRIRRLARGYKKLGGMHDEYDNNAEPGTTNSKNSPPAVADGLKGMFRKKWRK